MQALARMRSAAALLVVVCAACGDSKPSTGGGQGGMSAATRPDAVANRARPSDPRAGASADPARSGRESPRTSGPTGIAECDEALTVVCRCAEKNASLGQPCRTLGTDAPAWKLRSKEQDPAQLEDLRTACRRILKSVREAYDCK